jgi:hypothetical protein
MIPFQEPYLLQKTKPKSTQICLPCTIIHISSPFKNEFFKSISLFEFQLKKGSFENLNSFFWPVLEAIFCSKYLSSPNKKFYSNILGN